MPAIPPPPPVLATGTRVGLVALAVAVNSALYLAIDMRQPADARVVPPSALDAALGWHHAAIWPYWLLLTLAPAMAVAIRDRRLFAATLRAYLVAIAVNALLWLVLPTRLPRAPLPGGLDTATAHAWHLLLALDPPGNCFPSGHVTLPLVIAAGFTLQYPRWAPATWAVIALLLPSVVMTGQHVLPDVAGGAATALLGVALTRHPLLRRPPASDVATRSAMH